MCCFKGGPLDLVKMFTKILKKLSKYSQSLLIFLHKTPLVENNLKTREIRDLLQPRSTPTGNMVYFLNEQLAHLHTRNT